MPLFWRVSLVDLRHFLNVHLGDGEIHLDLDARFLHIAHALERLLIGALPRKRSCVEACEPSSETEA